MRELTGGVTAEEKRALWSLLDEEPEDEPELMDVYTDIWYEV